MERFKSVCRSHKLKFTPQRLAIYQELKKSTDHPSANRIYQRIKLISPSISFDTVHRTLLSFADAGLIHTVEGAEFGKQYDPDIDPHHHLRCLRCGVIIDFHHSPFDRLSLPKRKLKDFRVLAQKVVVSGICRQCAKERRKTG
jgi:Fur family peroxide stress response transcriptional regulator